ncbi:hypothetical protein LTR84_011454 [Exophiala bonariae]|uniref:Uncharacterized protein n=1 Tax=Exophiala bonariae TaxID=1690606 RepID=A0AAV9MRL6_9EURO|nr:hypothetical protein LTR84_011454 [Exophiala bonariae]
MSKQPSPTHASFSETVAMAVTELLRWLNDWLDDFPTGNILTEDAYNSANESGFAFTTSVSSNGGGGLSLGLPPTFVPTISTSTGEYETAGAKNRTGALECPPTSSQDAYILDLIAKAAAIHLHISETRFAQPPN